MHMYVVMYMCGHECVHTSTCGLVYAGTHMTRHVHRHANVFVYGILDMCEHECTHVCMHTQEYMSLYSVFKCSCGHP